MIERLPFALALCCAVLSLEVAEIDRRHWPIAASLWAGVARDGVGFVVDLPPALDAALLFAVAMASGHAYDRSWPTLPGDSKLRWLAVAAGVSLIAPARVLVLAGYAVACTLGALAFVDARLFSRGWTVTNATASVLLAGDIGGLLLGLDPRSVVWQAALQLGLAIVVQATWLASTEAAR